MQFAANGYAVEGNPIVLVDDSAQSGLQSIIRVGDSTAGRAAYVATIASSFSGGSTLNYSFGEANVACGALNDLPVVGGDLVFDGTPRHRVVFPEALTPSTAAITAITAPR